MYDLLHLMAEDMKGEELELIPVDAEVVLAKIIKDTLEE